MAKIFKSLSGGRKPFHVPGGYFHGGRDWMRLGLERGAVSLARGEVL